MTDQEKKILNNLIELYQYIGLITAIRMQRISFPIIQFGCSYRMLRKRRKEKVKKVKMERISKEINRCENCKWSYKSSPHNISSSTSWKAEILTCRYNPPQVVVDTSDIVLNGDFNGKAKVRTLYPEVDSHYYCSKFEVNKVE